MTDQLKAATDNSAQMKLQAALKDLTAEGRSAEAAAKRAGADLLTEQSRLERLSAEYQRIKTASLSTTSEHLVH